MDTVLFAPLSEQLEEKGVTMETAATQLDDQNQVTLVIRNPNFHLVTLEAKEGYWQVKMDPESVEKTAFTTHQGLLSF